MPHLPMRAPQAPITLLLFSASLIFLVATEDCTGDWWKTPTTQGLVSAVYGSLAIKVTITISVLDIGPDILISTGLFWSYHSSKVLLFKLKGPLNYKYIMTSVDVYESIDTSQNHYLLKLYLNNISFIFLYCTKPRLLKIHRSSLLTFCNVIEGKNKHNDTKHYAPYHN